MSTDPTALTREVLEREEHLSAYSYSIPLAAQAAWDATRSEQVKAAPDLARAVNELTAELDAYREEIARVEALADQYDAEARLERREGDVSESINTQATADRIRAALNGGEK